MLGNGQAVTDHQERTFTGIMDHLLFLAPVEWERVRREEEFDYVIVGSGFCGLAFAQRILKNSPQARLLIIEGGPFLLPEHFQNLPLPYCEIVTRLPERFPWSVSSQMKQAPTIRGQRGMIPSFGGRSTLWSGWCPRPTPEEMQDWPPEVIRTVNAYLKDAEELLGVVPADEIGKHRSVSPSANYSIYGTMQEELIKMLRATLNEIPSATRVLAAPLAVAAGESQGIAFLKFSTPDRLLALVREQRLSAQRGCGAELRIVTNCTVRRIQQSGGVATVLDTTRGEVRVGDAKLILAMGTLPSTTLISNSFPQVKNVGSRYSAHFLSSLVARVPREDFPFHSRLGDPEVAAAYIAGRDKNSGGQYHIQLTALSNSNPLKNAAITHRYMPDVVATASFEQSVTSTSHILFACVVVGGTDHRNKENWFKRSADYDDPTANMILQALQNDLDQALWAAMERATFQMFERALSPKGPVRVEYWHGDADCGSWGHTWPAIEQVRSSALMHEGSTLWIGSEYDSDAVVGLDYRPRGIKNVFITGGSLWPTAGSWNPTLTMVALAQHLADILTRASGTVSLELATREQSNHQQALHSLVS